MGEMAQVQHAAFRCVWHGNQGASRCVAAVVVVGLTHTYDGTCW